MKNLLLGTSLSKNRSLTLLIISLFISMMHISSVHAGNSPRMNMYIKDGGQRIEASPFNLEAGKTYTLFVTGRVSPSPELLNLSWSGVNTGFRNLDIVHMETATRIQSDNIWKRYRSPIRFSRAGNYKLCGTAKYSNNVSKHKCINVHVKGPTQSSTRTYTAASFLGYWINEDPETNNLTRTRIKKRGNKLAVHMWGKCHPSDCDWGTEQTAVSDARDGSIKLVWHMTHAIYKQELRILNDGRLRVFTKTKFIDNSGRPKTEHVNHFIKR